MEFYVFFVGLGQYFDGIYAIKNKFEIVVCVPILFHSVTSDPAPKERRNAKCL